MCGSIILLPSVFSGFNSLQKPHVCLAPSLKHCTVNVGLGLQYQDFLLLNMSFKILHFSNSYVSQLHFISGTRREITLAPQGIYQDDTYVIICVLPVSICLSHNFPFLSYKKLHSVKEKLCLFHHYISGTYHRAWQRMINQEMIVQRIPRKSCSFLQERPERHQEGSHFRQAVSQEEPLML